MNIEYLLPNSFHWDQVSIETLNGETGHARIKTQVMGTIKIRQVDYSANYQADHWCVKGHLVFVLSGQLVLEHKNNTVNTLNKGSVYVVGDDSMAHKAKSQEGASVLIVD